MTARARPRSVVIAALLFAALAPSLVGCSTGDEPQSTDPSNPGGTNVTQSAEDDSMTAERANTEQLELLEALKAAAPSSWGETTVNRFRTCTSTSGEGGVQITREIRGNGVADAPAAAKAFRDALTERGFDAEIRRETEVVGTGAADRFAAFNADDTASIIQAYSACYPFDLESGKPTIPPSSGD